MNIERILMLIDKSEDFNKTQKSVIKGWLIRKKNRDDEVNAIKELIETTAKEKVDEIILSTDDVKIYKVPTHKSLLPEYPYRFIYKNKDNIWVPSAKVSKDLDLILLEYMETKYLGTDHNFVFFVGKILGINQN